MSRKMKENAIRMLCVGCGKKVTYYENGNGLESFAKRVAKAGVDTETYKSTFKCRMCVRKDKLSAATPAAPAETKPAAKATKKSTKTVVESAPTAQAAQ